MKILQVSPYDWAYPGGVTSHVSRLSEQFSRMGHSVTILAPSSKPIEPPSDNLITLGRPIPLPVSGSVARVTLSVRLAPKVRAILSDREFDVVHLHEPLLSALPITVLRLSKSVNVGTFHAYTRKSLGYRSLRPILKRWFKKLHGKIAVSSAAAGLVSKYFPGYYNVIPNGIDLPHFSSEARPIEEFRDGKTNILFVGRLEKRKGLRYLLAAYAKLKWDHPDTRLIVVGPGKLDPVSERLVAERGIKDVVFAGGVPYENLPRYYRTADIFCSPATGKESFGIVLLEAMAAGKPVVASNIAGYAAVVRQGEEGLLVEPEDEDALASAITQLLDNTELRTTLASKGTERAREFSWEKVSRMVMDYYERLLSETAAVDQVATKR